MSFARVQATNFSYVGAGSNTTLTFGSTVAVGALITVGVAMGGVLGNESVTVADNQGNTYTAKVGSNNNDSKAAIYYAYNVASSGSFVITLTRTGAAAQETIAVAVEWSGFGSADPLVGFASNTGNSINASSGSTGSLGTPDAVVMAVLAIKNVTFGITGITVDSASPAFNEEGEHDSSCTTCVAGEIDDRIPGNGNAQSCSWTMTTHGGTYSAVIAAFYSVPPPADVHLTQMGRQTLEKDGTVSVRLTQMGRQVLYPFLCTPLPGDIAVPPAGGTFSGRRGIYVPTRGVMGSEGGGSNTPFAYLDQRKIVVPIQNRAIYVPVDAEGWANCPCTTTAAAPRTLRVPAQPHLVYVPADSRTVTVYDGEGYTHR